MKVLLINADGRKGIPNIALHKLAIWHEARGDEVTWDLPLFMGQADKVYISTIFTKTRGKVANLVGFDTTFEEDLARLNLLRRLECRPYVMRYGAAAKKPDYITLAARWANLQWAFARYDFQEFAALFGPGKARH